MHITLINPPITLQERYGSGIGASGGRQAPLGICYVAAFLEKNGISVRIIDAEAEELDYSNIISRIKKSKLNIVGITSTTVAFHRAIELANRIKESDPETQIIIGGPHVTALPDYTISFDCFDVGVLGEGEITTFELIKAIEKGIELKNVDGIVFRDSNHNAQFTKPREYIQNLDILPFPSRHLLPDINLYPPPPMNYRKQPVANIITSRGCPNSCTFCDRNVFGKRYREHSAEYVIAEIEHLIETYNIREIAFVDDTFTINKKRLEKIIDLMAEKGIKLNWTCMARVNTVSKKLLEKMKKSGCWHISYGIESGNQEILDIIKKGITLEQVRNAIKWSAEVGIHTKGFFIIGNPKDSIEIINETINFAKSLPLTDVVVTINTPIPNTESYENASQYGKLDTHDWSKFSYWQPVFVPFGFTEESLVNLQKKFYREFYFRPSIFLMHLKQIKSITDIKRYFKGIKAIKAIR